MSENPFFKKMIPARGPQTRFHVHLVSGAICSVSKCICTYIQIHNVIFYKKRSLSTGVSRETPVDIYTYDDYQEDYDDDDPRNKHDL